MTSAFWHIVSLQSDYHSNFPCQTASVGLLRHTDDEGLNKSELYGPPIHQQAALLISLKALWEPGGVWHDPCGADSKVAAIAGSRVQVHLHWELLTISSIGVAGVFLCSA